LFFRKLPETSSIGVKIRVKKYIYFRNDDVNTLDKELMDITDIFIRESIPITHAVEPANVSDDTVLWLLELKEKYPRLIEIMQHGFDHKKRSLGEFGGNRPYEEQLKDISTGKKIMEEKFGNHFLSAINFPSAYYNKHTIRVVKELDYDIVCSHYNYRTSRRIMYFVGNIFKMGQMFGKHVSHHMQYYPRTNLFEIDMCISFIKKYIGGHNSKTCLFNDFEINLEKYDKIKKYTDVIGLLIHHRYHHDEKSLLLVKKTIDFLRNDSDVIFTSLSELYKRFAKK